MFQTRINDMLHIRYPIVGGTMMWISTPEFVAAILSVVAGQKARRMYETGDLDEGVISCGQGVGLVHDIPTVKELFARIMNEAGKILSGLGGR
jgi:NAD(P)H-dependent flavin oxidoreductase YrpB (nitropropane dioxygenase family)